jgi:hypothetical protein
LAQVSGTVAQVPYVGGTIFQNFDNMSPSGTLTPAGWWAGWHGGDPAGGLAYRTNLVDLVDEELWPLFNEYSAGLNCGGQQANRSLGVWPSDSVF